MFSILLEGLSDQMLAQLILCDFVGSQGSNAPWRSSSPGSCEVMHPHGTAPFLVAKSGTGCELTHAFGQRVWLPGNTERLRNTQSEYVVLT